MWLSILVDVSRSTNNAVLRVFELSLEADLTIKERLNKYQVTGIQDAKAFDDFVMPFVGNSFECEIELDEAESTLWVIPNFHDEQAIKCLALNHQLVKPTEADWAFMTKVIFKLYAELHDDFTHYKNLHHTYIEGLKSETAQELVRHERKAEFFRTTNPEKWAEMVGRLDVLRKFQERLETSLGAK